MKKTSRTDEPFEGEDGYYQSPNPLSNGITTNEDSNGIVHSRALGEQGNDTVRENTPTMRGNMGTSTVLGEEMDDDKHDPRLVNRSMDHGQHRGGLKTSTITQPSTSDFATPQPRDAGPWTVLKGLKRDVKKFFAFIGPGFMISVAYIDPGNYATDIAAGASYRFRLLFVVLLSNLIAIFLQSLAIKLGTVSGFNLAEACRAFLPPWLNYILYIFAEVAIIATDIAEVIGFAIALNLLAPKVPLVAGCAISIIDVVAILFFYRPEGPMKTLRIFEIFVILLVLGVVICFCIQMSLIRDTPVGDVFRGYLPSNYLIRQQALYQACGILGATVMPHSIYLGSGIVQPRLRDFDKQQGLLPAELDTASIRDDMTGKGHYIPSLVAIRHCLKVSTAELAIALFTFALFVNSSILIVAGASLYDNPAALDADIFGIHDLLSKSISPAASTVFALALLLSGVSAGIVCTIAGQMVSEGALNWKLRPWLRRLVTRSISIVPSIIIAGAVGRSGLDAALNGTQVALSIVLPFVTAPLIYFTSRNKYMTVQPGRAQWRHNNVYGSDNDSNDGREGNRLEGNPSAVESNAAKMANSWYTTVLAVLVWLFMGVMNVANLALLGKT